MRRTGRPRSPVSEEGNPIQGFAHQLRELHMAAGYPTTTALVEAGVAASYSSVSTATRGDTLPTWEVTKAIVTVCRAPEQEWLEKWATARNLAQGAGLPVCQLPAALTNYGAEQPAASQAGGPLVATEPVPQPTSSERFPALDAQETPLPDSTAVRRGPGPRRLPWSSAKEKVGRAALIAVVAVLGGVAWKTLWPEHTSEAVPTCDDIGVALDDVAHRVYRQTWIDAYNAHGGRDALGCPRPVHEQGLVHAWAAGLSQDLVKDGRNTRLMSITFDKVIVMTGRYFDDYTDPHWNFAAGLQGYPETDPITCGNAQVVYLTSGDYTPGAMVTTPDDRFVWLPRPVWRRYLEQGGPMGPLGRPLNRLGTSADVEGAIEFENGTSITLHAGTASLVPAPGTDTATTPATTVLDRPC